MSIANPADAATQAEYEAKLKANAKITGFGLNVTISTPCPFCAAPDWLTCKLLDMETASTAGATCSTCGRGCKTIYTHRPSGGISFEFVQTGGDDPPPYLPPMRRLP